MENVLSSTLLLTADKSAAGLPASGGVASGKTLRGGEESPFGLFLASFIGAPGLTLPVEPERQLTETPILTNDSTSPQAMGEFPAQSATSLQVTPESAKTPAPGPGMAFSMASMVGETSTGHNPMEKTGETPAGKGVQETDDEKATADSEPGTLRIIPHEQMALQGILTLPLSNAGQCPPQVEDDAASFRDEHHPISMVGQNAVAPGPRAGDFYSARMELETNLLQETAGGDPNLSPAAMGVGQVRTTAEGDSEMIKQQQNRTGENSSEAFTPTPSLARAKSGDVPIDRIPDGNHLRNQDAVPSLPTARRLGADHLIDPSQVEVVLKEASASEQTLTHDGDMHHGQGGTGGENPQHFATSMATGNPQMSEQSPAITQSQADGAKGIDHGHIIAQVKEKLAAHEAGPGNGVIMLKLHPEELGELKLTVQMVDQRLKVEIVAQNQGVKDALMNNLDSLKETLSRQNVSMDSFDVSTGGGQEFNNAFREGRQAALDRHVTPRAYLPETRDDGERNVASYWRPRENALVDVRL